MLHCRVTETQPTPRETRSPAVFVKFLNREILGETGRLLFSLLNAFAVSGYRILLFDSLPREHLNKYGQLAYSLEQVTLIDAVPEDTAGMIYLFDSEDRAVGGLAWRKKIQIKFDVFSPYWFTAPILLPFPVHPAHAGPTLPDRLKEYRASARRMRIFFSGETKGYVKSRIRYPKEKLPRLQAINALQEQMGDKLLFIRDRDTLERLYTSGRYTNKFVLLDSDSLRIDDHKWLWTVAQADFFLCPPGYVMPMCHNAVEAMAVGTTPIINYPEWFDPSLTHLRDCVTFDSGSDLIDQVNAVLEMDDRRIAHFRERVIDYYESHLTSLTFTRNIERRPERDLTVLIVTEANAARNASRLGRRSIIIRGTSASGAGLCAAIFRTVRRPRSASQDTRNQ
jgi:hypothetical protein